MEIFYSEEVNSSFCHIGGDEAVHLVKVLRHRVGDEINVIDGLGTMYKCVLTSASPKSADAQVIESFPSWGGHPYRLTLAVCPTKNIDRYEWFIEKATELGVDRIVPLIGEHSERKIVKPERLGKILLSAAKQSLKAKIPELADMVTVKDFIKSANYLPDNTGKCGRLGLIAYCFEEEGAERISVKDALNSYDGDDITILIGPEGDFSREEALLAIEAGMRPVHLGNSRLRTETAAVTAAEAAYFKYM